jgi:hypothetical protein
MMEQYGPRFIRKPTETAALKSLTFQGRQDDTSECTVTGEDLHGAPRFMATRFLTSRSREIL